MTWQPISADILLNIAAALLVLFGPGLLWHAWSRPARRDTVEQLADLVAISLSIITLAAMLASLLKITFTPTVNLSLAGFFLGITIIGLVVGFFTHRLRWKRTDFIMAAIALLTLAFLAAYRLYQARGYLLPAWVDSVHHTLIVQKFLDVSGLPATLAPELNIPFTYHYGFHAAAALFAAVSGSSAADAVLWFGQVMNALIALSTYRISKAFFGDWRKAAVAALLSALAFQMPGYYVSWGRYTLSSGLVMLGPALAAALEVSRPGAGLRGWGRLLILTAGILLAHYMTAVLLAVFLLLLGGGRLLQAGQLFRRAKKASNPELRKQAMLLLQRFVALLWAVVLGVALVMPRLWNILLTYANGIKFDGTSPLQSNGISSFDYTLNLLGPLRGHILLGIAAAALIVAIFRKPARPAALWCAVMLLLSLPWGFRFGPFRPDLMAITLFIPLSVILADLVFAPADWIKTRFWLLSRVLQAILLAATACVLAWGAYQSIDIANESTQFVDSGDQIAIAWIKQNTPSDARFYVNITHWQGGTYRGMDGGYWLLPLTRRQSIIPPSLYTDGGIEEVMRIKRLAEKTAAITTCDENFWQVVTENQLSYVYLKSGVGTLQPEGMQNCEGVIPIYNKNGIALYEIVQP